MQTASPTQTTPSTQLYYVYTRTTGSKYLTTRATRVGGKKYRWTTYRTEAARLAYAAAKAAATRYGGRLIEA